MDTSDAVLRLFQPVVDILCYLNLVFKVTLVLSPLALIMLILWIVKRRVRRHEHV